MQAIVRFSITGEPNAALRNRLLGILYEQGFEKKGNTATYETPNDITAGQLRDAMRNFWQAISAHPGPGAIDHFWMYTDEDEGVP